MGSTPATVDGWILRFVEAVASVVVAIATLKSVRSVKARRAAAKAKGRAHAH